jgi:putative DNA primase/helicase
MNNPVVRYQVTERTCAHTEKDWENRDSRDTASDRGLQRPGADSAGRDIRNGVSRERFRLVRDVDATDDQPAGVYAIGKEGEVWICGPLEVIAQTRDESGNEWGRLNGWRDNDGRTHLWAMPMHMLAGSGDELRAELLRGGLILSSHPSRRRLVTEYIAHAKPEVTARCVQRTGWHGDAFVLPNETFGASHAEPIIFQTASPDGIALGQAGTLEEWRENIAAHCAGNSRLVLALSCAFAGPCIGLLGAEGGGVHLRGPSSTGKSTALSVAASVFGSPRYVRTWRSTDNALESVAALHSDLLLPLDELGQLDPRHAGAVAYMIANGQGKGRSRRDGSARAPATWRVLFLSTGEVGIADLVTESGGKVRAGQEVRIIDVPAGAGVDMGVFERLPDGVTSPGAFADQLKRAVGTHYGHALPAFLHSLTADPTRTRETLRAMRDALTSALAGADADGQVRRVANRLALIAAAGELATFMGLTGWPQGEAESAIRACFATWLESRGTKGPAETATMLAQARAFFEAHGESRFTPWDRPDVRTVNRAGFRRTTADGQEFYVFTEAFRREIAKGFDHTQFARALAATGALLVGSGESTRRERLPGEGLVRVYRVTSSLWEATP